MMQRHGTCASESLKLGLTCALIAAAVLLGGAARGDEDARTTDEIVDCGTMALGALLMLEGRPTEPDILLGHLRPSSPAGPSLRELRDAAGACGLALRGVLLSEDRRAIDRPTIVFLKRPGHGHFQLVRPVGHTGELAQVIDPNLPPFVIDTRAMFAASEWTGIALIPDRQPGWPVRIAWVVIGGTALAGLGWISPRLRWRRGWIFRRCARPLRTGGEGQLAQEGQEDGSWLQTSRASFHRDT